MSWKRVIGVGTTVWAISCTNAALLAATPVAGVDPLTASVDVSDAVRFAKLFNVSQGRPTSLQLQEGYLDKGSKAVRIFTPNRIKSPDNLAQAIAERPELYRDAINRCLPLLNEANAELRSIYLSYKGLFPDKPLPAIKVVFGAANSGGTAGPGMQVLGLEVLCKISPTRADFLELMRGMFAHETAHTFQSDYPPQAIKTDRLLAETIREGTADYLALLTTGRVPQEARNQWAREREDWLWDQFEADRRLVRAHTDTAGELDEAGRAAFARWIANAGHAPAGWPSEAGYWIGMRICEAYVSKAFSPRKAIQDLLTMQDPNKILQMSGYERRHAGAAR
jgi:Predicted Zn-dependent protease (DUF2268)